jgi:hypothetical protein
MAYHRAASVRGHERFRDQVRNAINDLRWLNLVIRRYCSRGLQCETAREDCQAPQHYALGFS